MRSRTRIIAAAAAVSAAVAAGSGVAVAASSGGNPGTSAKTTAASEPKGGNAARAGHDAMVAVVARDLHLTTARVAAALAPIFAAGYADPTSPVFATAAGDLGVSTQQLAAALTHAKLSLAGAGGSRQGPGGGPAGGSAEKAGHDAMVASVAQSLNLSTSQVSAALAPLFAAGRAETESPLFRAAARHLGVSAQQLETALAHAKQSLARAR